MADSSRLDDLRRRVDKDPASIAFAQLAEEYRRAGEIEQAIQVCRAGLDIHPGYLSARVTLGRALVESNQLDDAQAELERVLHSAPENLAAIRGLAEIHHRRGHLADALDQYRAAFAIARNDPDLERTVEELSRKVEPQVRVEPDNGLSFASLHAELLAHAAAAAPTPATVAAAPVAVLESARPDGAIDGIDLAALDAHTDAIPAVIQAVETPAPRPSQYNVAADASRDRAHRTIAALERWLDALNVSRTDSRA